MRRETKKKCGAANRALTLEPHYFVQITHAAVICEIPVILHFKLENKTARPGAQPALIRSAGSRCLSPRVTLTYPSPLSKHECSENYCSLVYVWRECYFFPAPSPLPLSLHLSLTRLSQYIYPTFLFPAFSTFDLSHSFSPEAKIARRYETIARDMRARNLEHSYPPPSSVERISTLPTKGGCICGTVRGFPEKANAGVIRRPELELASVASKGR